MELKTRFAEKRITRGYTQEQLCKEINKFGDNCMQSEISAYENLERLPSIARALIISKVLKCTIEELYYFVEEQK